MGTTTPILMPRLLSESFNGHLLQILHVEAHGGARPRARTSVSYAITLVIVAVSHCQAQEQANDQAAKASYHGGPRASMRRSICCGRASIYCGEGCLGSCHCGNLCGLGDLQCLDLASSVELSLGLVQVIRPFDSENQKALAFTSAAFERGALLLRMPSHFAGVE